MDYECAPTAQCPSSATTMPITMPSPIGARRMSLHMLSLIDKADQFQGLPRGTAKPMKFLHGFQEAEPYLGLPAHAFKLLCWLVKQTEPHDWEEGSRPIAWPSARRQAEFLCLSPARVKALNRTLFEAGIFVMRDNEQGRRYGRRNGPRGPIIEAFGFDLSPLAQRYDEFIRIAAEAKIERDRMKEGRRRVTLARRAIRQIGEQLVELGAIPEEWVLLETEAAAIVRAAKTAERSEELALLAKSLGRRQDHAEQWLRKAGEAISKPVETDPTGLVCEPHTTSTNLTDNLKDTVIASEKSSSGCGNAVSPPAPPREPLAGSKGQGGQGPQLPRTDGPRTDGPRIDPPRIDRPRTDNGTVLKISTEELVRLAPRLKPYLTTPSPAWPDIVEAADWLRHDLGVSQSLWGDACLTLGREQAAIALSVVSSKPAEHFTSSAGSYFHGMIERAKNRQLNLSRTIWGLRENAGRTDGSQHRGEKRGEGRSASWHA